MTGRNPTTTVDEAAAVCEFLVRCGVSDHMGEGVSTAVVADHLPIGRDATHRKLRAAVDRGDLEDRPWVKPHSPATRKAYTPRE